MNRVKRHTLFWIVAGLILTAMVGIQEDGLGKTLIFVALLLPVAALTSFTFNYYLFPKYLYAKRHLEFALYSGLLFVLSLYITILIILGTLIFSGNYTFDNLPFEASNVRFIGVSLYLVVALSSVIHLLRHQKAQETTSNPVLEVKSNRKNIRLEIDSIKMIESLGDYVKIHSGDEKIVTKEKISSLAERLPESFIRVHRSFIINKTHVKSYNKESIQVGTEKVPISRTFKKETLNSLELS